MAKPSHLPACLETGAAKAVERERNPFAKLRCAFDATFNFATWDDGANLLSCLREGALGHAITVHPPDRPTIRILGLARDAADASGQSGGWAS